MSSQTLEVPAMLNIPQKLWPIFTRFNEFSYFLLHGGRGGAKSQSVARFILYLCEKKNIRVVCGREFQNSIDESVYTIFKDLIQTHNLNFEVLRSEIRHRQTGATINFRGFREQGATNIKGLEGVHLLWVDEAQAITKTTLDVVIPTIRKEKSRVIWTMNRHVENDPVFVEFSTRQDCLTIAINYDENEHCTAKLRTEAELCRAKSPSDYEHIWLGKPLAKSEDYLFSLDMIRTSLKLNLDQKVGIQRRVMANDVARYGDCENVFTVIESRGPVLWEQIHQECFKNMGIDESIGKHLSMKRTFNLDVNVVDDDGVGGGITDNVQGIELIPFRAVKDYEHDVYADRRTDAYFKLQDWMQRGWLKILNDPVLHEQLLTIRYKYTPNGKKRLFSKEEMRRDNIKSPDRSDALMMAVFYSDHVIHGDFNSRPEYAIHGQQHFEKEAMHLPKFARAH